VKKKQNHAINWVIFFAVIGGLIWLFTSGEGDNNDNPSPITTGNFSEGDPAFGPDNARVVLEEYSDFQCPACKGAAPQIKALLTQYPNDVRLVYNDFPLSQLHRNAQDAAEAAQCANEQGKFWEYHDTLFDRQDDWHNERTPGDLFFSYAEELELDGIVFSTCVEDRSYQSDIQNDIIEGRARGVQGTPTIFLNGEPVSLSDIPSKIEAVIASTPSVTPDTANEDNVFNIETSGNVDADTHDLMGQ